MFYLGENTIDLMIKLIEEINEKKKIIKEDYFKLEQFSKIKNTLDTTSKLYYQERDNVLKYLENYNNISKEEFDKILVNIKLLNTHRFYGRIDDEDLTSFHFDYIHLSNTEEKFSTLYTYKRKNSMTKFFSIPVISETKSIIDDDDFINTYKSAYSIYKDLVELNEVLYRYNKLQNLINGRRVTSEKNDNFELERMECGKRIRTLRNNVSEFYKEHPEIKEIIESNVRIKKKFDLNDMALHSLTYFEGIYMHKVLRTLYETLKEKNESSKEFGNTIINCLDVKIESTKTNISDTATCFKQSYILKFIDSIYPGFRESLITALKHNNIRRISYLERLIVNTLYLEDNEYDDNTLNKIKCL